MNPARQYIILNKTQKVEPTDAQLANRLRDLIHRARWKLPEASRRMGLSEAYVSHLQNGNRPFSYTSRLRILELENEFPEQNLEAFGEPPSPPPYGARKMELNPAYATPPPEPTRAQIEARVAEYLDAAARVPGGIGFAWVMVNLHLKPEALAALDSACIQK